MQDPALVEKLRPTGIVLRITYTDPDAVLTVDMPNTELHEGAGNGPEPNVELFMTADTGNRFWLGKVILPVALAKGQVRRQGTGREAADGATDGQGDVRPVPGAAAGRGSDGSAERLTRPIG